LIDQGAHRLAAAQFEDLGARLTGGWRGRPRHGAFLDDAHHFDETILKQAVK
jgi:hypothetical protein